MAYHALIVSNPKAAVLARFPKAKCVKDWSSGRYTIQLGETAKDFNGHDTTTVLGAGNPAATWENAVYELRLLPSDQKATA
jgi:hypothetical protein